MIEGDISKTLQNLQNIEIESPKVTGDRYKIKTSISKPRDDLMRILT